jgi:hypothetical protein
MLCRHAIGPTGADAWWLAGSGLNLFVTSTTDSMGKKWTTDREEDFLKARIGQCENHRSAGTLQDFLQTVEDDFVTNFPDSPALHETPVLVDVRSPGLLPSLPLLMMLS